jgi:pimeloyl-ACP methyl ester carboxylesterase
MSERRTELHVQVADEELADLRERLARTRYIRPEPGAGWNAGVPVEYLRELLEYWRTNFKWRNVEDKINSFSNARLQIDDINVHCVLVPGTGEHRVPILLAHGWPSSFLEHLDLATHLAAPEQHGAGSADSFDVVIASTPGFGYSDSPINQDWASPEDEGETFVRLMSALGHERFAIHTNDIGASAMRIVLLEHADRIIGYHTTEPGIPGPYPRPAKESVSEEERERLEYGELWHEEEGGYFGMLATRPQTLAHGLNDSPAGLAAWIAEKWWSWTVPPGSGRTLDEFLSPDQVLSNIALYWHTQTINSANWGYYRKIDRGRTQGEQARVPVGVALTTQPIDRVPRAWAERFFPDIRSWVELGKGGHFVAMEEPALLATAIRDFIRPLRTG